MAHGLVEAQSAAIEKHLVHISCAETSVDGADAFVTYNHADAMDRSTIMMRLVSLSLEFSLQLHAATIANQPGRVPVVRRICKALITGS